MIKKAEQGTMSEIMNTCNKMMQEHHGESEKSTLGETAKDKKD
ncbi:MAG: hypothetical protein ACE5HM_06105 [Acidiferrobacterales bacterium]